MINAVIGSALGLVVVAVTFLAMGLYFGEGATWRARLRWWFR